MIKISLHLDLPKETRRVGTRPCPGWVPGTEKEDQELLAAA